MKTIDEIRAELEAIFNAGVNMTLYLGTGDSDARVYRRADFDDAATHAVCQNYIASLRQFLLKEELSTRLLSEIDARSDTLFRYDLAEQPAEFQQLTNLYGNINPPPPFTFADTELAAVKSIAVKISSAAHSVVFFKKFYPVSLVKRDQILLVVKDNTRFTVIDQDILKVTPGFDVMLIDNEFYINDFSKFEKSFAFDEIANRAMQAVANTILATNLVNDVKGHLAACHASRKDILRAARSPVLAFNPQTIIAFALAKQHQIGLKVDNGQLQLTSKDSVKKLYKLLNDDYLTSGLTSFEYETLAKNQLI